MSIISTKPDSNFSRVLIDHDRLNLINFYRKQGFFDTKVVVSYQGDSVAFIIFQLEEGIRAKIFRIYYPEDSLIIINHSKLRPGDFLIEDKILVDIASVEDYLADEGYPFARLSYFVDFYKDTLHFFWDLKKGKQYYIRKISIIGLENVPKRVVTHNILFKKGEVFSQKKIKETQKNIYLLFLFKLVDFQYEQYSSDSLDIIIKLEEGSPLGFNFGIGFMTPDRLLGSITFENLNVLKTGNQLILPVVGWINVKGEYSLRTSLGYKFLYPIRLPISVTFGPFIEKEKRKLYGRLGYGIEGVIRRTFFTTLETSLSYQYKVVKWEGLPLTEGVTNSLTSSTILDLRDDILDPKRGIFFLPTVEYGGGFLGGDNNFVRYLIDVRAFPPVPGFVFAWRFRIGDIFELPGGLATHEKYQVVSSTALRGYHDYEIGPDVIGDEHYGLFLVGVQMEPRFRIGKFGFVLFLDLAALEESREIFKVENLEMGTGFGLRYFTPIGPLRLDYGKRIHNPKPDDKGMIYFSLQHAF